MDDTALSEASPTFEGAGGNPASLKKHQPESKSPFPLYSETGSLVAQVGLQLVIIAEDDYDLSSTCLQDHKHTLPMPGL